MELRNKSSWPKIIDIAKQEGINTDNIILLLAFLEFEDINSGNEIRKLESRGLDIFGQTKVYCKWLRNTDFHYQNYLKRLDIEQEPFEFVEYICEDDTCMLMEYVELISAEFSIKEK